MKYVLHKLPSVLVFITLFTFDPKFKSVEKRSDAWAAAERLRSRGNSINHTLREMRNCLRTPPLRG